MEHVEQNPPASVIYDWYETDTTVLLTILANNTIEDEAKIFFSAQNVSVRLTFPDNSEHIRQIKLDQQVDPSECSYTISPAKVTMKLKKVEAIPWEHLEGTVSCENPKHAPQGPTSKPEQDWRAIDREIEEEEAKELRLTIIWYIIMPISTFVILCSFPYLYHVLF